jgi:hypothetical protein
LRQVHGHILDGVHRQVGAALRHGHFQFLDEQALAADAGQGRIQDLVALGGHAQEFHFQAGMQRHQARLDVFGLPERELAFPGGDDDFLGHV